MMTEAAMCSLTHAPRALALATAWSDFILAFSAAVLADSGCPPSFRYRGNDRVAREPSCACGVVSQLQSRIALPGRLVRLDPAPLGGAGDVVALGQAATHGLLDPERLARRRGRTSKAEVAEVAAEAEAANAC